MRRSRMMFRTLSDRTTGKAVSMTAWTGNPARTFIFADVLESKGIAGILAFDDADFAKGALANHTKESEMVQVHWIWLLAGRREG